MSDKKYTKGYEQGAKDELEFTKVFIDSSKKRGKAIEVIKEDVSSDKLINWLSELYDLRQEVKELKNNPFKAMLKSTQKCTIKQWRNKFPNFAKWLDDNGFVYKASKDKNKR